MNTLREDLDEYMGMRRALGFKLKTAGKFLDKFVTYSEGKGAEIITTSLSVEWAQQANSAHAQAQRMSILRAFARYRSASDPRTEIPPDSLYPYKPKRAQPYLYSDDDAKKLLSAANSLRHPFRAQTYRGLFGLLFVTGLRIGEALSLQTKNVNLDEGTILIEGAKHGKSRLLPIHSTTQAELTEYNACREKFLDGRVASHFFISLSGTKLDKAMVHRTFYEIAQQAGLRKAGSSKGPRIHDFRHSFAVRSLLKWYRYGADVERRLPILSAYLGHVHVSDTYWYLTGTPELMDLGVKLLEHRWEET